MGTRIVRSSTHKKKDDLPVHNVKEKVKQKSPTKTVMVAIVNIANH